MPNDERRKNNEARMTNRRGWPSPHASDFGLRTSNFFRHSDFGFRISLVLRHSQTSLSQLLITLRPLRSRFSPSQTAKATGTGLPAKNFTSSASGDFSSRKNSTFHGLSPEILLPLALCGEAGCVFNVPNPRALQPPAGETRTGSASRLFAASAVRNSAFVWKYTSKCIAT